MALPVSRTGVPHASEPTGPRTAADNIRVMLHPGALRIILAAVLLGSAAPRAQESTTLVADAPAPPSMQDLRGAMQATLRASSAIPDGPPVARVQPEDLAKSCEELYYERVVLMQRARPFAPAYYDDPRNQAAAFMGSVFTPFYYLWGYTAFESYYDARRIEAVDRRLDALRQISARKDCFVRH